jgi:hypothetical protein
MTFDDALNQSLQLGARNAEGLSYLAMVCQALSQVHAISPALVYAGAVNQGLTGSDLRKLNPVALGNLMFS